MKFFYTYKKLLIKKALKMFDQQGSKKSLQVIVDKVEFAKDFHYFITVEIEGDNTKRRTDISESVNNPIFETNKFFLPLHE